MTCLAPETGPPPPPDPVDPAHVADPDPGWYHGDFHMHALHSSPDGPAHEEVAAHAREVGLDFLPITEYVTTWHHQTWGSVAAANPDLVVWPGREVITYDGHPIVLGETPNSVEYRHGFRQITMGDIQRAALADGALFGLAHPTIFPEPPGVLQADAATLTVTVRGAAGQTVDVVRNGLSTTVIPVPTDSFSVDVPMRRGDDGEPLGTFYRVDVREPVGIRSIVSNPMWLAATEPAAGPASPPPARDRCRSVVVPGARRDPGDGHAMASREIRHVRPGGAARWRGAGHRP